MTKQEQINEMAVIGCVRNPQAHTAEECAKCDFKQGQCNAYRHAERLYSAGYRKVLLDTENGSCVDCIQYAPWQLVERKIEELKSEYKQLEKENEQLKAKLEARLNCNFVKTAQKQAVQEFVEKLKEECCKVKGYEYSFANIAYLINQVLEEQK